MIPCEPVMISSCWVCQALAIASSTLRQLGMPWRGCGG